MRKTLYCGDVVLAGTELAAIEKGAVLVEGDRIAAVDRQAAFASVDAERVECPALVPGFIDCHDHLALDAGIANWPALVPDPEGEHMLRAIHTLRTDLHAGVTTARCLGDKYFIDILCRKALVDGRIEGPRILVGTRGIKASHAHGLVGYPIDGVEARRQAVRDNIGAGADFIKLYITDTVWSPELAYYPSREEIAVAVDEAHRVGKQVAVHCIGGPGFDLCLELGVDIFEHGYFLTTEQIDRLIAADRWLDITPTPIMSDYYGTKCTPALAAGFRNSREPLREAMTRVIAKGVKFALGSDGLHGMLANDMGYLVEFGATPLRALEAATIQGARLCGLEAETGSLDKGKWADIVGLQADPRSDIRAAADVMLVVQAGRQVLKK